MVWWKMIQSTSWSRAHYIRLWSKGYEDVVQVKNLMPDLLTTGVQGRVVICQLAYLLKRSLVFLWESYNLSSPVGVNPRHWKYALWHHTPSFWCYYPHLLCSILLWWPPSPTIVLAYRREIVEVSRLESILEHHHKLLLVLWGNPDGGFVKADKIVPQ